MIYAVGRVPVKDLDGLRSTVSVWIQTNPLWCSWNAREKYVMWLFGWRIANAVDGSSEAASSSSGQAQRSRNPARFRLDDSVTDRERYWIPAPAYYPPG